MILVVLILWIITALLILLENKVARVIIYLGVFSLIAALGYLMLGAPDVAMAEAAASAFTVIFFVICFEKYFGFSDEHIGSQVIKEKFLSIKVLGPLGFVAALFFLVAYSLPEIAVDNPFLRNRYLTEYHRELGGTNPVGAILLGYRVYDTLFEALVVVVSVVAAIHLSAFGENSEVHEEEHSEMENSGMAVFAIQIICPVMLMFGVYLVLNGHLTPGGGFQGGLAIASFFICRYMIYDVNDLPIHELNRMEEIVFVGTVVFAAAIVFFGAAMFLPYHLIPFFQTVYMTIMNALIGLKVAFGFIILFYRYIAIESK